MIVIGIAARAERPDEIDEDMCQCRRRERSEQPSEGDEELRAAVTGQLPFQSHGMSSFRAPAPATLTRRCACLFDPFNDSR
jgi:hypothetical protein